MSKLKLLLSCPWHILINEDISVDINQSNDKSSVWHVINLDGDSLLVEIPYWLWLRMGPLNDNDLIPYSDPRGGIHMAPKYRFQAFEISTR